MKTARPQPVNQAISADPVQVAKPDVKGLHTMALTDAIRLAASLNSDLVLVNDNQAPPICRIRPRPTPPVQPDELPLPLALALKEYRAESQPFRKIHRLIDGVEVLVKLHTVIILSRFFRFTSITDDLKGLLCGGLRTPSLGIWWAFAKEFNKALGPSRQDELSRYVVSGGLLFKQMESRDNLIWLRNNYAHGATPGDEHCRRDLAVYEPRLLSLCEQAWHLRNMRLIAVLENGTAVQGRGTDLTPIDVPPEASPGRCYAILPDNTCLSLHPLLVFRERDHRLYFYNDLREHEAVLLNYEDCLRWRHPALYEDILNAFPIHEWADSASSLFQARIELLTETFKGRRDELREILNFLTRAERGFLFFWGGPGAGKSALMARAIQMLSWPADILEEAGILETPLPRRLQVIEYFIRRDMQTNNTAGFFSWMHSRLERNFRTGIKAGRTVQENIRALQARLERAAHQLQTDERLVLFIDGLDEATEAADLLESLPRSLPTGVLTVYASREHPDVRKRVYENLDRENRRSLELGGLNEADTRTLLSEYVSKYQLQQSYIEALERQSAGNPLYLRLICRGLTRGDYQLNDAINLPAHLAEIYEGLLKRLSQTGSAVDLLRLLAVARTFLTADMAADIMKLPLDSMQYTILPACREVLFENPGRAIADTEKSGEYQLYHESLREYFLTARVLQDELYRWRLRLCEWCAGWRHLTGAARKYALRYLADHLLEVYRLQKAEGHHATAAQTLKQVMDTLEDEDFRRMTFRYCGNSDSLKTAQYQVQAILVSQDQQGEHLAQILKYAWRMHTEEEERYAAQVDMMLSEARKGGLDNTADFARMGVTPRDRLFLVLRTIWQSPAGTRLPASLEQVSRQWLRDAADPVLERFWRESVLRLEAGVVPD